jgi:hypothetical protein
MSLRQVICLLFMTKLVCLSSSLPSSYAELVVLDRIYAATASPDLGAMALGILERVAEGRPGEINALAASKIGLKVSEIQDPYLKETSVRAYALYRIGEATLPEALDYLARLKRTDLEPDDSGQLWPTALVGLNIARLNRIPDQPQKAEFLEKALQDYGGIVARWAAGELCDLGSQKSIPFIRDSMRKRNPGQRAEGEIRFCEAPIQVLSRDLDRVRALTSVLRVDGGQEDSELQVWAVRQLVLLHLPQADQALDQYRAVIERLPEQSPERQRLYTVGEAIRTLKAERTRRGR